MGALPAVTFQLVDATPYRLIYLMTSSGQAGSTVLPNAAGVTPDLRTDSSSARVVANSAGAPLPLHEALSTPFAGGINQNTVRQTMLGGGGGIVTTVNIIRAEIQPCRTLLGGTWSVDCNEGAAAGDAPSAGFGVYIIATTNVAGAELAYLSIHLMHTKLWRKGITR